MTLKVIFCKYRSSHPEVFCKKGVLRNFVKFTGKHLCQSLFSIKIQACNFIKKEALALMFSCSFCEISQNTFFFRTAPVAASVNKYKMANRSIQRRSNDFDNDDGLEMPCLSHFYQELKKMDC